MVKCIICGKEATGDTTICKRCMRETQKQGGSYAVEQMAAEKIFDDVMCIAELTEDTTTKRTKKVVEAMLNINNGIRRDKSEEKQKSEEKEE